MSSSTVDATQPLTLPEVRQPSEGALWLTSALRRTTPISRYSPSPSMRCSSHAVPPDIVLFPDCPLFETILSHTAVRPLHVYSIAGHYELDALAVAASQPMLSFPLLLPSDDDSPRMGPVYLLRLFSRHLGRVAALKRLLAAPATVHAPTDQCDGLQQRKVQRAWTLATSAIIDDARADTPTQTIEATLGPLLTHLLFPDCRTGLIECIMRLLADWSAVKVGLAQLNPGPQKTI